MTTHAPRERYRAKQRKGRSASYLRSGESAWVKHPFEVVVNIGECKHIEGCRQMVPEVSLAAELHTQLLIDDIRKLEDLVHEEGKEVPCSSQLTMGLVLLSFQGTSLIHW